MRMRAANAIGRSPPSDPLVLTTLPGPPDAPARAHLSARSLKHGRAVTAAWREPRNNGAPITLYRVEFLDHRRRPVGRDGSVHPPADWADCLQEVGAGLLSGGGDQAVLEHTQVARHGTCGVQ